MFDISFFEITLVLLVALVVLGPERLPRAAKMVGLWVRRAKASWYSVKAEFERELADDELKRSLQQAQRDIQDAKKDFEQATREPASELADAGRELRSDATALEQTVSEASRPETAVESRTLSDDAAAGPEGPDGDMATRRGTGADRDEKGGGRA